MLIADEHRDRLQKVFEASLEANVAVVLSSNGDPSVERTARALLSEITELSPKLFLVAGEEELELVPGIALVGEAQGKVTFAGLPTGYELAVLVDAIVEVSRGRTPLTDRSRARLSAASKSRRVRVYTTPT